MDSNKIKKQYMSHKITFYPLGNADTTLIQLENGKNILFDFANTRDTNDVNDKRVDLPAELNKSVTGSSYNVVAFSHADNDHINGFSEFFYLEHAEKYQGKNRKKIDDLWVPAAVILETNLNGDAAILRAEAAYRLKNKQRIKVFSKPDKLKDWLEKEGIKPDEVKHLIVNAGTLVPGWMLDTQGVEFFVHSPFAEHIDDRDIERNEACIVLQATFNNTYNSKVILGADAVASLWDDIVSVTKYYKRETRLNWDIFHISHHCSYLSLNADDRGNPATVPTKKIKWLFEAQGNTKGKLISPSWEIPNKLEEVQPPHLEAANYYRAVANAKAGEFKVTMEFPNKEKPEPLVIEINDFGVSILKTVIPASFISSKPAPRAGDGRVSAN